jgi:serine/threonine-protein kinase
MELVEGQTLREVLREGRKLLPERALEITVGVLDALSYSHKAGIVHRDIKPANVMLTPNGQVKVMDFGIARAVADTSATMTQTAAVIGTAQYLSPEQARGETVDARSDLYSAGCLLYELLVGRPPFVGDSPVSVAYQHVRETPVAPSQLDPEITPDIDAITLKALAKDPDDRYQSAREFRNDITRVLAGQQATAVVPRPVSEAETPTRVVAPVAAPAVLPDADDVEDEPKRRGGLIALIVVLALIGLTGIGYGVYRWMQPDEPVAPAMVAVPTVLTYTEAQAKARLEGVGLKTEVRAVNGAADTKGQVTQQDPIADTSVAVGSTVTITVNKGPQTATIPDGLVGRDRDDVEERLNDAGFDSVDQKAASTEPGDAKAGEVLSVSPKEGSTVPLSTKVTITYATGESTVPNLVGVTRDRAENDAEEAGFDVRFTEVETDEQPAGLVVSQDPDAGSKLGRGETIALEVAKAPKPTPTPTPTPTPPPPTLTPTPTPSATPT